MKNPIEKAVRLSNAAAVIVDIDDVQERLDDLNAINRTILPVEAGTPGVKEMKKELQVLRQRKQIAKFSNKGYPPFALEALSWRRDNGFPILMCYSLESSTIMFRASRWAGWNTRTPELPPILRKQYKDFMKLLNERAIAKKRAIVATSTYSGLIPLEVKEEIKNVEEAFTSIWVVAETAGWTLKELKPTPPPSPRVDPLVIGVRGRGVYLIASYDTTDIEKMAEELSLAKVGE